MQAFALTAPGTTIQNRAELTYVDAATGERVSVQSNLSLVSVGQFFDLTLLQDSRQRAQAGDIVQFAHRLTNTGNTTDSYRIFADSGLPVDDSDLQAEPVITDSASTEQVSAELAQAELLQSDIASGVQNILIFEDVNGNGSVDADDLPLNTTRVLDPADTLNIVVQVTVQADASVGSTLAFRLLAESLNAQSSGSESLRRFVTDEIEVESGPIIELSRESFPACEVLLFPGDAVTHMVQIENTGSSAPKGARLFRDNEVHNGFVVEQALSEHFRFNGVQSISTSETGARPVVRLEGVADNSWITADQWNGTSRVASVGLWFDADSFDSMASAEFTVTLQVVDANTNDNFYSSAAFVDLNGDSVPEAESNNTCHQFSVPTATGSVSLRFLEPANEIRLQGSVPDFQTDSHFVDAVQYRLDLAQSQSYVVFRDGVYLELDISAVTGGQILLDAAGNRYVVSTVKSELTGDSVNVVLLETTQVGVFRSIAPIRLSTQQRADGAHCPRLPDEETVIVPEFNLPHDSCVLASGNDDQLQGLFVDATGVAIADVAIVNPQALVFNAQTHLPVEGALVSVVLASTDEIATDLVTGALLQTTTGANGLYSLPRLQPDIDYYLRVEPPASHRFPSEVPFSELTGFDVRSSSYGVSGAPDDESGSGVFRLAAGEIPDPVDIPVDSNVTEQQGLVIEKIASLTVIEPGQTVGYQLRLKNADEESFRSITICLLYTSPSPRD